MHWLHSGSQASTLGIHSDAANLATQAPYHPKPVEFKGQTYLVCHGYLVPFFRPSHSESERNHIRERLNMELCDRVFRISDARDVSRDPDAADEAIVALMQAFETSSQGKQRGIGRVLFGRIVSRIRTLSKSYLDLHRDHADDTLTQDEIQLLKQVHDLYEYVMVQHPEIFSCVRLFDHSEDLDGIIEEVFSEIGKTQQLPIEAIYASRVRKIGEAMSAMDETLAIMLPVIAQMAADDAQQLATTLKEYTAISMRLVGIPSSDHLVYDHVAGLYVEAHDAIRLAVKNCVPPPRSDLDAGQFTAWLEKGVALIHSMQNIRDGRPQSVSLYRLSAAQWHPAIAGLAARG